MDNHELPMSDNVQAEADGPPPEPATTEGETVPLNASDELTQTQKQRDDYFEQLQRNRAEFANYQKRARSQAEADRLYAVGSLARDLLESLDNLERGAESLRATAPAEVVDGLTMIHRQLLATLAKHGIEPIEALGQPFDPNQHEALLQQPVADVPEGTVVAELGKGYKLHDRVLRPSKVAVSIKPTGS
jgi:molecular chaperone GrpE